MRRQIIIDFETASTVNLPKSGAWRYAEDPTTEVLCVCYKVTTDRVVRVWRPGDAPGELAALAADPDTIFIAHNVRFEKAMWREHMVSFYGFPPIAAERWHDTMASCSMRAIPAKLEKAALVLRLPMQKDMEGSRLVRAMSKPGRRGYYDRSPEKLARVVEYCKGDVLTEEALHARVRWLTPEEHKVWQLDQTINDRGVKLDMAFVQGAQAVVRDATVPLAAEFKGITGYDLGQVQKITEWVRGEGVPIDNMQKATLDALLGEEDEDAEDSLADNDDRAAPDLELQLPSHVERALRIRRLVGSASVKKLAAMFAVVASDGRAHDLLAYHIAGPGRWAGRLIQPQNFPRPTIEIDGKPVDPELMASVITTGDVSYVEAILGAPVEAVVSALRGSIVAAPGHALCVGDFAGIEARVVLALAGQHDKAALMASGADVYCDMASSIFGRTITKKNDPEERQTGKNTILGCGFGMGARKFQLRYAKEHTLEWCQNVITAYRKKWAPEVEHLWWGLERAAIRAVWDRRPVEAYGVLYRMEDGWLTARLPSGRKLWYRDPEPHRAPMPWDANDIRPGFTYKAWKQGRWLTVKAYGGLLTENVVQGLARDLLVSAMFKCEAENMPVVLTVHDEIVAEPTLALANEKLTQQIMEDRPPWAVAMQVPVAAETWLGPRYRK